MVMNNEEQQIVDEAYENYVKWIESPKNQNNKNEIVKIPNSKEKFIKTLRGDDEIVRKMGKRYCDEFIKRWGLKIEERELSMEERLPKKIKLTGHGGVMEFSLTDKRELNYYGRTKESNESKWRTDKLKDNEVFYQTEFGWGVFLNTDTFETVTYDGTEWGGHKLNMPTKLITVTYKEQTIERYE
jgi:hypothetical protein